jgi:hypothetical protein
MLFDPEIDLLEDILAIRQTAMDMYKAGVRPTQWTSEGTSVSYIFTDTPKAILEETRIFIKKYNGTYRNRTSSVYTQPL